MVTFNVDSLDFSDDETARFGAGPDFDLGFDSANTRLELDDLVNSTTAYVQQNRAGDLVDGRLAQTVEEGKVLADDGNLYDTLSDADNAASSWIKAGPGHFSDRPVIATAGLTVLGSGWQTVVTGGSGLSQAMILNSADVTIRDLAIKPTDRDTHHIDFENNTPDNPHIENILFEGGWNPIRSGNRGGAGGVISNCRFVNTRGRIEMNDRTVMVGCHAEDCGNRFVYPLDDCVIAHNTLINCGSSLGSLVPWGNDNIVIGNRVHKSPASGIYINGTDCIVANNRVSDSADSDINDSGTGTVLDANLTGSAN